MSAPSSTPSSPSSSRRDSSTGVVQQTTVSVTPPTGIENTLLQSIIDSTGVVKSRSSSLSSSPSSSPLVKRRSGDQQQPLQQQQPNQPPAPPNAPPPPPPRSALSLGLLSKQIEGGSSGSSSSAPGSPTSSSASGIRKHAQRKYNAVASFLSLTLKDEVSDTVLSHQQQSHRMTWSDFESEYEREIVNIAPELRFPAGEVIVRRVEKKSRMNFSPTAGLVVSALDSHIHDIIHHFNKDYLIVQHRGCSRETSLSSSSSSKGRKHSSKATSYPSLSSFLNNGGNGGSGSSSSSSDDINNNPNHFVILNNNNNNNNNNGSSPSTSSNGSVIYGGSKDGTSAPSLRSKLFSSTKSINRALSSRRIESSSDDTNLPSLSSIPEDPIKQLIPEKFGLELLCQVKELKFQWDVEPFFCSLYIVDLEKRERISESFNFHLNSKQLLDSLKIGDDLTNGFANQNQCIFSLNKYHPNIGDIERDIKPYIKDFKKQNKQTVLTQFKSEVTDRCMNWGTGEQSKTLQPFVWTAYPVFQHSVSTRPALVSQGSSLNLLVNQQQTSSINVVPPPPPPPPLPPTSNGRNSLDSSPTISTLSPPSPMIPSPPSPTTNAQNSSKTNIEIVNMVPATPNLSDRSICELLLNDKDLRKSKTVQAAFSMSIRTLDAEEELKGRVTPSLIPVLPIEREAVPNFIREIQDFSETPYPHTEYTNNLYIYPEMCFIKFKNPNIQIQAQLVEDLQTLKSLKCIYPTSAPPYIPNSLWDSFNNTPNQMPTPSPTIPFPPLEYVAFSGVSFHDKRPHFTEEFKIKLPTKITTHHLLFTFYHVNVASSSSSKKDQKTAIGYAAVPLLQANNGGVFLKDDYYHVPIEKELNSIESAFLDTEQSKKEKRDFFTFRTKLASSVVTQDTSLHHFFKYCCNPNNHESLGKTLDAVRGIQKIDRLPCVQFFPVILDQLFQIMCLSANEVASQAFTSILHVIKIVDGYEKKAGTEKSRLLTLYSEYMFDYIPDSKYVYEELCRQWVNAINTGIYVKDFRLNWFLFDIMTKSMALSLSNSSQLDTDLGRENRFQIEFQEHLNRLVLKLLPQLSSDSSMSVQMFEFFTKFPYFINNLFPLIDRGFLFNLIYNYISRISLDTKDGGNMISPIITGLPPNSPGLHGVGGANQMLSPNSKEARDLAEHAQITLITIKFNFLKIICDYDHYIPLNFPQTIKVVDSIAELNSKFFKRHFIAVLLLNEVESCLRFVRPSIRNQAILTLKQLLKKHHFDTRYQSTEIREKISSIYFPFVLMMVEHYSIIKHSLDHTELLDWITCLVWILQYCNRELLRVWLTKETETRKNSFMGLMSLAIDTFKQEESIHEIILLNIEMCRIILNHFKSIDDKLLNNVITNIQKCSSLASVDIVPEIYNVIKESLIPNHPTVIFNHSNNNYCELLSYELLSKTDKPKLSTIASSLFYFLLESNFNVTNDITRMKVQSTVAFSKLVGEVKLENASLNIFLSHVKELTKAHQSSVFRAQIDEWILKINTLMKYSNTISENKSDCEMVAEMYYNISNSYFESPNLRVTWLENLAKKNNDHHLFDEAAQCLIQSAYLVSRYLHMSGKLKDTTIADFAVICPNISRELELPPISNKDDALFQMWTVDYLVKLLEESISLVSKSERYELAIEIHSLISKILKSKKDYKALMSTLSNQKQICETIVEKSKEIRLQSKYYRIAFYGPKFEDLNNKEFIYKKPPECLLKHITTQITQQILDKFAGAIEKDAIVLMSNAPFDRTTLVADKLYYQVISVEPYVELSATNESTTLSSFDPNFGVSSFISETAYSQTGGKPIQEDISKQSKKKTIFVVDPLSLPYLKNRVEITSKREIILSPIENAIELIKGRILKLMEQVQTPTPRINLLQQVIQGSVVPMVNEGPLKICEVFLSKQNVVNYAPEHVEMLKRSMERFIYFCGLSILLNKRHIQPQHQDFQNMVEKQFDILKKEVNTYM
ncbi:DOCK family protein [Cavenderia fasciculata]|uniref:DOCK family protein n=1 Tax=Cavenderia fasciculata TaxID=261658 RepID=F4Q002_CACFS|nr:DOCK family protein [Cavenderia fasciculata]EGG18916.1 DOCK family protein [Cavenderia fasciculata]|eukprot:XP_004357378.1 DOCK family protein [Cavenderia fasciculata]